MRASLYPNKNESFWEKHSIAIKVICGVLVIVFLVVVAFAITPQSPYSMIGGV